MSVTPALPDREVRAAPTRTAPEEPRHTPDVKFHDAVDARRAARSQREKDSGDEHAPQTDARESAAPQPKREGDATKRAASPRLATSGASAPANDALELDPTPDDSDPLHATRTTRATDADASDSSDPTNGDDATSWTGNVAIEGLLKHTLPQPALSSATSGASDSELAGVAGPSLATSKASADAAIAADLLQLGQRDPRESDAASRVAGPGNAPAASTAAHANKPAAVEKPPATIRATPAELPRVFDRLAVRVHDADRKAVVELDPPELGRLSIALSLEGGGRVRAEMRAEQPSGYAALQSQISQLHASLIERGFTSASVDLQLGLANQDSQQSGARRGGSRARAGAQETLSDADVRAIARAHDSAIDMWA